jgi:hypothetical protein
MEVIKIINSGLINRNELAAQMYPGMKRTTAGQWLYKKLNNKERQTFNASDQAKAKEIFLQLFSEST